jgi:hypothetical protein
MPIIRIVLKGVVLMINLSVLLPKIYVAKRLAQRRFQRELLANGLSSGAVQELTKSYGDMVNLNPLAYRENFANSKKRQK